MGRPLRVVPTLAMKLACAYGLRETARKKPAPPYVPYSEDGEDRRKPSRVVWASAWHRWKD